MVSRRAILKGLLAFAAGGFALSGYAFGIEPARTVVTKYRLRPPAWPRNLHLRLAVLADIHACEPWMGPQRIRTIVAETNSLQADVVVLLGDYGAGHRWVSEQVHSQVWASELGRLKAPLGVHAVLGNHDWWEDKTAQRNRQGPIAGRIALEHAGIAVYENDCVRLTKAARPFWIAGLGDQIALLPRQRSGRRRFEGVDDLPGTLGRVTDDAPVILLAHEPDIFPRVPARVALTLSGHTHGGQVRILGYSPIVPSRYRNRYAYGHVVEDNRHLIVSGGLGCSIMPVRLGVPPEIVLIELGGESAAG